MKPILTFWGESFEIESGLEVVVRENCNAVNLQDLGPHSKIEWCPLGGTWHERCLIVTETGSATNLLGSLGPDEGTTLLSRAGQTLEFRCTPHGTSQTITFRLRQEEAHLKEKDRERMLLDFHSAQLAWEAENGVPSLVPALTGKIDEFSDLLKGLIPVLEAIVTHPVQMFREEARLVSIKDRFRLTRSDIAQNLRTGRLSTDGMPNHTTLIATQATPTPDTAENAFVVQTARVFGQVKGQLAAELEAERKRLTKATEQEASYIPDNQLPDQKRQSYEKLLGQIDELKAKMNELPEPNAKLPPSWWAFRATPHEGTNAVRFDPRYQEVGSLRGELEHLVGSLSDIGRAEKLEDIGRRRTWQLYEYWVLVKVYTLLRSLGFQPVNEEDSFQRFEDYRGPTYGLRRNHAVCLRHKEASHVRIKLWHEREIRLLKGGIGYPDIVLELQSDNPNYQYGSKPLILDAKYSRFSSKKPQWLIAEYEDSARGYQDSPDVREAAAYLVHLGSHEEFADKGRDQKTSLVLHDEDYPYQGGVIYLHPQASHEDGLRRAVVAWLFVNGFMGICVRCGKALEPNNSGDHPFDNFLQLDRNKRERLTCQECNCCNVINYCYKCKQYILKLFPAKRDDKDEITSAWRKRVEITSPSARKGFRHCPKCNAA